jgi:hypothetical protein
VHDLAVDAQIHAALVGGAIGGAFVAIGLGATWRQARREAVERRRESDRVLALRLAEDERDVAEQAAWELVAAASQVWLVAGVSLELLSGFWKRPKDAMTLVASASQVLGPTAAAFGRLKTRQARFPELLAAVSPLMTAMEQMMGSVSANDRRALDAAYDHYEGAIPLVHDAIAALRTASDPAQLDRA